MPIPAAVTKMWTALKRDSTTSTTRSHSSTRVISARRPRKQPSPPTVAAFFANASNRSCKASMATTRAPSPINANVMTLPIPPAPPVIMAILPSNNRSVMFGLSDGCLAPESSRPRIGRRLGVKKLLVIDPRRRQSLLVPVLRYCFEYLYIVLDVIRPVIVAHQRALLGDRGGHPRIHDDLRVGPHQTVERDIA